MVEGEAGIGKTTLMSETAATARGQGFRVLTAQDSPAEVTFAYAAVADLLRDADDAILAGLPQMQRIALQRARDGADGGAFPATDERTVAGGFLSLIERLGERVPALLMVDDAHWLDASSRAVIGYTVRRLCDPVGVMLSFRTDEVATDERSWLPFRDPDSVSRVRMQPLSLGGVHTLIAARLGHTLPRPIITRIHKVSGGNPFFALELAAAADANDVGAATVELPDSLAALVRNRIGDGDDDTAAVLLAAACSPSPTVGSLCEATGMSASRVVEVLEPMENSRIITLDGARVRFTHPLFATGVYTDATPAARMAMHRTLAGLADRPELKARHLALAGASGDAATLSALDAAAEATVAQGAPAVAAELIELAVKLGGDEIPRRIRAGELHLRAGSLMAARAHLETAVKGAPPGVLRCLALMWLGGVKAYDDDMAGAVESMSAAVDEAGDDVALGLLCVLRLAYMLVMADRLEDALPHADRAVTLADRLGVPSLRSQALSMWILGKFVSGQGLDHEALQAALDTEDPQSGATTFFQASAVQAMTSAYTGDLERARIQMRAVQQRMLDYGTEVDIIWAAGRTTEIALWSGHYADATRAAQDAVEHAEQMGGRLVLVAAWTQQAAAAAYTGREAEARTAARASIVTANEIGAYRLVREPTYILAFLEVSLGNYHAALALLQPYLKAYEGPEIEGGRHLPDAIETLCVLGEADSAMSLVEHLERSGELHDRPWMLAMGARGRGHLLAALGDLDGAQRAVQHAMTHHQRLPMPFETARTQLLLGQLLRRRRRKHDAAAILGEALDTFERLGAPLWASRARAEIDRVASPRPGGENLTAAEQRTANLAASGLTNRQIAAQLFVSDKTVEMNLSKVYRKLAIRSREGLAAALQALHGDEDH
jgi:DNA-binding CsgD family transcriptional regulator